MTLSQKEQKLTQIIAQYKKVAVAFSAGVDSTLLLKLCTDVLGTDNVVAITASSQVFPQREQNESNSFCKSNGIQQVTFTANQLDDAEFCANTTDRCYICKKAMFTQLCNIAKSHCCDAVLEGSNLDDCNDYRPGMRAIEEFGIISPLQKAQLTKAEIRQLSHRHSLKTASKPSLACLATRIEYAEQITTAKLKAIDQAEQLLLNMGITQARVRLHGTIARIEVLPEQMPLILTNANTITFELSKLGFTYITLDLNGYRQGSMNLSINR